MSGFLRHSVEGVFSVCGDLCARKRNRTSANLEQRTFLRMNKKYWAWTNGWLTVAYLCHYVRNKHKLLSKLDVVLSSLHTFYIDVNSFVETSSNFS